MAGKTSHFGDTAVRSIDFAKTDMEHFIDFADEMKQYLPAADVTYIEKPMFGKPYVQVTVRNPLNPMDSYTLMVDEGQTLHIGSTEVWVGSDDK